MNYSKTGHGRVLRDLFEGLNKPNLVFWFFTAGFAFGSFIIKFCLNNEINKEFVSIWLNNKLNKLLTEREKIGAIQGNITIGTIENFDIPVPPLAI